MEDICKLCLSFVATMISKFYLFPCPFAFNYVDATVERDCKNKLVLKGACFNFNPDENSTTSVEFEN